MSDRSVRPVELGNESERGDEGRVSDGNGGAFDRMLEPFDQDKEEREESKEQKAQRTWSGRLLVVLSLSICARI